MKFCSHVGRTKYCKKGRPLSIAVYKAWSDFGQQFPRNTFRRRSKRSPRSTSRSWRSTRFLEFRGWITCIGVMWLHGRNSHVPKTIYRCLWIFWCSETQKQALIYLQRRPTIIIGTWMVISHCLNLGSEWHDSRCSTISPKGICGFNADWRRNRSQQDEENVAQKDGQIF